MAARSFYGGKLFGGQFYLPESWNFFKGRFFDGAFYAPLVGPGDYPQSFVALGTGRRKRKHLNPLLLLLS